MTIKRTSSLMTDSFNIGGISLSDFLCKAGLSRVESFTKGLKKRTIKRDRKVLFFFKQAE